ncbi:uncharacterized protein LOC128210268 [Mya arenaria]|uniref:uncharacterized protein LOC128210268 n=1 Tax=Mya arenaria TaxID=6604 RepID=UPI0022E4D314|nr:uncharacterized protein LOC128210268 [Mya arenaria]
MENERERIADDIARYARRMLIAAIILVPGVFFVCAAPATPGWMVYGTGNTSIHAGIWFLVSCTPECETIFFSHIGFPDLKTVRIMSCIAAVFAIFAPIVGFISRHRIFNQKDIIEHGLFGVISTLGAGVLGFVMIGMTVIDYKDIDDKGGMKTPYSLVILGIGSAVELAGFVLYAWTFIEKCRTDKAHEQGDTWVALSQGN